MCCTLLRIPELEKAVDTKCNYLTNKRCTIYGGRPHSCATYECGWLQGANVPKPNKAGFVVDSSKEADFIVHMGPRVTRMGRDWLDRLRDTGATVIVRRLEDRTLSGDPDSVEAILDRVRANMGGN